MKVFYIVTNLEKQSARETEKSIIRYLREKGAVCRTGGMKRDGLGNYTDSAQVPEDTQCIITIGGDGTLIQAARDLAGREIPFIGVNKGHLGYLTQISREEDIEDMLDTLLNDRFRLEKRMMLTGQIIRNHQVIYEDLALNEIVITRKDRMKVLRFAFYVNDEFLKEYNADGMIIATPTGSTAYNLSAGGPIVEPSAKMMVVTPVCSHALGDRSIVFSAEDELWLEIKEQSGNQMAAFDGDKTLELEPGDAIKISKSQFVTQLIQLKKVSFLENLSNKLS